MATVNKNYGDKIYRGGYTYYKNNNPYSEETFEVFKEKKEFSLTFVSEIHSRITTGEMLSIYVNYHIAKDYSPITLNITRRLGNDVAKEIFKHDPKENVVYYSFYKRDPDSDDNSEEALVLDQEAEISTPPRFHIAAPASCTGMLFVRSKKSSVSGKNFYASLVSQNQWEYIEKPEFKSLASERVGISSENINVEGHTLPSFQYKVYEDDPERSNKLASQNAIKVWLSQHSGVPYIIRTQDGIKVQIKYLNILEADLRMDLVINERRDFYQKNFGNEFVDYYLAHRTRSLHQKLGRLLRTETDRGGVIIVDSRIKRWKSRTMDQVHKLMEPYEIQRCKLSEACDRVKNFLSHQN